MIETCESQDEFARLWHARLFAELAPTTLAEAGARVADRAAWVFVAAYQGAMQQAFPQLKSLVAESAGQRWASYLVSEARGDSGGAATCTLRPGKKQEQGRVLQGHKNWVAARGHLGWLVVNATLESGDRANVLVAADAPGVALNPKRSGRFLPELAVATAEFDGVEIPATGLLGDEQTHAPLFGLIEARCLLVAMAGHFAEVSAWAPEPPSAPKEALALAQGIVTAELGQAGSIELLLAAMDLLAEWFEAWKSAQVTNEPAALSVIRQRWAQDGRLVTMHRGILQKRLEAAT